MPCLLYTSGIIALAILLQLGIMMFTTYFLRANAAPLYVALDILAMVTVFSLINRHDSSAYRLAWIVVVLMTPIVGMALYWLWGRVDFNKKEKGALNTAFENGFMKPVSYTHLDVYKRQVRFCSSPPPAALEARRAEESTNGKLVLAKRREPRSNR